MKPAIGYKKLQIEGHTVNRTHIARWNGEAKRCPKKGEYFISGAVPIAYRAVQDMTTEYYIAVLERVC